MKFTSVFTLLLSSGLVMASQAYAGCEVDAFGSVDAARKAESQCFNNSSLPGKQGCLDQVADWWFDCGGKYVAYNPYTEMTRIFEIQLKMEPSRVETISNLSYYTFSIEVENIKDKTQDDFTSATLEAFTKREKENAGKLDYYNHALSVPPLIIATNSVAKDASRVIYYANLKQNFNKACSLLKSQVNRTSECAQWITSAPYTGPCGAKYVQPELGVCVAGKVLVKYKKFDR